jgi:hypothetical protein
MIPASKKQKQSIAILTKNDREYKASLVQSQTLDPTKSSTNNLTHTQANNIIIQLGGKPLVYDNWAYYDKAKKSHKYILSLSIQYGWLVKHDKYGEVADLCKISEWLKSEKSPVKIPLQKMTPVQVSKVIAALENMVSKHYK